MFYYLILGFRKKPQDLGNVLASQGFELTFTERRAVPMKFYWHSDGVGFICRDCVDAEELEGPYDAQGLAAQAMLSAAVSNEPAQKTQEYVGRFLRDRYGAILKNAQSGKLITD